MLAVQAIIKRMSDQGLGIPGGFAENQIGIFAGTESDLPKHGNGFYTVIETPGRAPIGTHNEGPITLRQPSFQITARASRYITARTLSESAFLLMAFSNLQIDDRFFLYAAPVGEPFSLPNDGNGRVRVAFNMETTHR